MFTKIVRNANLESFGGETNWSMIDKEAVEHNEALSPSI